MSKKTAIVVAVMGFGTHIVLSALSQFNLSLREGVSCILYVVTPAVVALLMLGYVALTKTPVMRMAIYGLLIDTAMFLLICVSVAIKGGIPEGFTGWKIFQFWLVNLILWSPISLGASAIVLYFSKLKVKTVT
ncbi:hypothetical protein A2V80_02770 [Candidatus Woesebacteria bacterium RBG_16_39_8b]|uniref:Uncharacterized protein n=1 Tax=Candidatus Woesebacteria bacterium RBG_16_39_8b TaxID=1802482 RepID=A0A1F7X9Q6_9BACT|nr:MAG: hypothetical protein A2V80_02770 [Candidatus Woesebacteria bacterium RBG_16_39_8b]